MRTRGFDPYFAAPFNKRVFWGAGMVKPIQVRLVRSPIGRPEKHRRILQALGLTRMHRPVNLYSSPQVLGALRKVVHLVKIEER